MPDSDSPSNRPKSFGDTYEAARQKINYQTEVMEALDNKALRTFRYALLTAGLVLTGFSIKGLTLSLRAETSKEFIYLLIGLPLSIVGCLFVVIFSLMASRVSNIDFGPSQKDIEEVLEERPNKGEWLESTLKRQSKQIADNRETLKSDQRYLVWSQIAFVFMIVGLFFLFLVLL